MYVRMGCANVCAREFDMWSRWQATGYISPEMFRAVLKRQLPALQTDDVLLSRLYAVADRDDDGRLDYREFCMSASRLLRGSMMEKLDLLFSLFDVDGNGSISIEELIHLLKHQHKELDELVQFATGLFVRSLGVVELDSWPSCLICVGRCRQQSMDVDASGSVTREEFAGVLAKDPVIRETFLELVLLKFGMKQQVHALQEAHPEFTFASLRDVVRRLQKTPKVLSTQVDSSHFVQFMQDQWSMPSGTYRRVVLRVCAWSHTRALSAPGAAVVGLTTLPTRRNDSRTGSHVFPFRPSRPRRARSDSRCCQRARTGWLHSCGAPYVHA